MQNLSFDETYKNIACKITAIFFRLQYVDCIISNITPSDNIKRHFPCY